MKEDPSLGEMLDSVFTNIGNKAMSGLDKALGSWREKNKPIPAKDPNLVEKGPRVKSLADITFGLGLAASIVGGILSLVFLINLPYTPIGDLPYLLVSIFIAIAGGGLLFQSRRYKDSYIRLNKYLRALGSGTVAQVDKMARLAGVNKALVVKEVNSFIQDNTFKEAQLVENDDLFILDYQSYKLYEKQVERLDKAEADQLDQPLDQDYLEGKRVFSEIKKKYPQLRREGQDKLLPLITTIERIYKHVDEYPDNKEALGKFSSYYIPSCQALLDRYLLLQESENLAQSGQALRALEQSFLEINGAFEELLDRLGGSMARDTLSEVSVLKTLMKQDGLLDRDFEMEESNGPKRN